MYAQYFLPKNLKGKVPLLMWHGGGLTGVSGSALKISTCAVWCATAIFRDP